MEAWKVRSDSQYARTRFSDSGNEGWDGTPVSPSTCALGYIFGAPRGSSRTGFHPHGDETAVPGAFRGTTPLARPVVFRLGRSFDGCDGPYPSGSTGGAGPVLPEAPR
ncbi:hypothetical protein GCM10027598_57190 [Amycolatopsis oliviviridis]|uniref:Cupin domain-containing protein n=1 Tax=Amycolatopsis oliviviridis TaxID=1471590 RepID=A0ABQ3LWE0_9PSEU|nr:hypothetical protein GCM10017790_57840 [Amycolatopsis oliviviridis]